MSTFPTSSWSRLNCGGCFQSVEETNHGGAFDSFKLNYNGNVSPVVITNGTNYTAVDIGNALTPLLPAGVPLSSSPALPAERSTTRASRSPTAATLANTNVPVRLAVQEFTAGASGFVNETDKGGLDDRNGNVTPTGNHFPAVTVPAGFTIPLRTPFALTGSATDEDGDTLGYSWEQNDAGGDDR